MKPNTTNRLTSGAIISLLGIIASAMIYQNTMFFKFMKENSKDHNDFEVKLDGSINWTHSIKEYVIDANSNNININKESIKNNEKRIVILERK